MRIAFFHELHYGGARRVVWEYANVFQKHHFIDLYYVDNKKEEELEKLFNSSSIFKFKFESYTGGNFKLKLFKDLVEPVKLYFLHKKIAREIDKKKYDFVFVHPSRFTHAPFILRFLKTPTVYFCHEPLRIAYDPLLRDNKLNGIKGLYELIIRKLKKQIDFTNIRFAKTVLANSNFTKNNIKKAYGVESITCYLGINPKVFRSLNEDKKFDLIFVGEDVWIEGYDTLTQVLKLFPEKPKTKIIRAEKGKHISDKDLVGEYNKSKVLVVLGRFDPFSMIPWEGMACGIPVVVVNEGGPVEAIKNKKTGFLVERNAKIIKNALERLWSSDKLRKEMGERGRIDVLENWTWEKSYERVMDIVRKNI